MNEKRYVVKRGGQVESFDDQKLIRSIAAACRSVRTLEGEAQTTAVAVCKKVRAWMYNKPEVTSADIRRKATEALVAYNPDGAYMYRKDSTAKIKRKR